MESESRLLVNESYDPDDLSESGQQLIYDVISENNSLSLDDLQRITGRKSIYPELKKMLGKGAVFLEEKLKEKYQPRKELFISLNPVILKDEQLNDILDRLEKAPRQKEALMEILRQSGGEENLPAVVRLSFTKIASLFGSGTINTLVKKGYIDKKEIETDRMLSYTGKMRDPWPLDENQQTAITEIREQFKNKNVILLHGVTSSGKTEIYIHLIEEALNQGKQVLYLLPEIALTSQIISRLKEVFGDKTGIYHSRFSDSERVEVFMKLRRGEYQIILGVRSAVFLPFTNPGLIIIDEEHENTYKQFDPAPRYHARDAAIMLASLYHSKVLLGTATPSVESYTNAVNGKYGLVKLEKRFGNILLPEVLIADVRMARRKREMRSVFTPLLLKEIEKTLDAGKQVILFQNRRGYSSFVECDTCGWIPRCNRCDVSLTYHKFDNRLHCHYCGYSIRIPELCGECGSSRILTRGFGTELVEDEIALIFPGVRVSRLDLDSSRSRRGYEKILEDFADAKLDILVGTQMLSKGLDFEKVATVGILNADQMLNFPDFRAFERSFQLMAQVSGRAGRKNQRGKVIIQTSDPSHPVIRFIINNDFAGLYRDQVYERQAFGYPPFVRMIKFVLRGRDASGVNQAAEELAQKLRKVFGKRVLGPQAPLVSRVKNQFLQQIVLKIEKKASFNRARMLIKEVITETENEEVFKKVRINIDVDPS